MGKKIKEYWSNSPKLSRTLFWIFLSVGTIMIIASWFIPPMGIIDASVLAAFGEILGFASIGIGIDCVFAGMSVSLQKGDTLIDINNNK